MRATSRWLVPRTRSSHHIAARVFANFGFKRHQNHRVANLGIGTLLSIQIIPTVLRTDSQGRHGRACPGHPRLWICLRFKTWMPGTRPGMTGESQWPLV